MPEVRSFTPGDAAAAAAIAWSLPQYFTDVPDQLAAAGVSVVEVRTLDRSAGYPPYEATRAFWERRGLVQVDLIDPLPGWPPDSDLRGCAPPDPLAGGLSVL